MSLWRGGPLILASKSRIRRQLLEAAGIPVEIDPADVDERAEENSLRGEAGAPERVAAALAAAKARAVARRRPGLVLGADQTLALGSRRFSKPASLAGAREQLTALAGKTHALHAAAALAKEGEIVFETISTARLTMRPLAGAFLDVYLAAAGERVRESVGGYQLEGLGIHLFERVEGDHFSVLGLPLLPLLAHFRAQGYLVS